MRHGGGSLTREDRVERAREPDEHRLQEPQAHFLHAHNSTLLATESKCTKGGAYVALPGAGRVVTGVAAVDHHMMHQLRLCHDRLRRHHVMAPAATKKEKRAQTRTSTRTPGAPRSKQREGLPVGGPLEVHAHEAGAHWRHLHVGHAHLQCKFRMRRHPHMRFLLHTHTRARQPVYTYTRRHMPA